jgi:N-acetyl-gamma-glutamylphosphate reductase
VQVGIVGGSGYSAGELMRLLLGHPQATHRLGDVPRRQEPRSASTAI